VTYNKQPIFVNSELYLITHYILLITVFIYVVIFKSAYIIKEGFLRIISNKVIVKDNFLI